MFRKYEKTFRIPTPGISNKRILSSRELSDLCRGTVVIEEKIDGANVGIIGTGKPACPFRLQKRGSLVDTSEHEQFNRFKAWAYERYEIFSKLPKNIVIYGEFMWATHHIYYDQLPDWFIGFDIFNKEKNEYLELEERNEIFTDLSITPAPLIFTGHIDGRMVLDRFLTEPNRISRYSSSEEREGIVVKNYKKQMRAKLVRPSFIKEIDEDGTHWTTHWDPRKINKLKENTSDG